MFLQARDQFDEIARLVTDIELVDQDIVPCVFDRAGRAGQGEQIGAACDAAVGKLLVRTEGVQASFTHSLEASLSETSNFL